MPNLVARDKQGGGIHPPQALSISNRPGEIGLRISSFTKNKFPICSKLAFG